jgi:hypothetical protein
MKTVKIIGIGFAILVAIIFISMLFSGEAQDSFKQGMEAGKNTVESVEQ